MTGAGFPVFEPVLIEDSEVTGPREAGPVAVEVRCHYFVPRFVVVSVMGSAAGTVALDEDGALDLARSLTAWVAALRKVTRGYGGAS